MKTKAKSKKEFQWEVASVVIAPTVDAREAAREGSSNSKVSPLPASKRGQGVVSKTA
jgi:hypothetical protein